MKTGSTNHASVLIRKGTLFRNAGYQAFEDFRPWLKGLQYCFSTGFKKRPSPSDDELPGWTVALTKAGIQPATLQFDNETLGGYIKYATIIAPV